MQGTRLNWAARFGHDSMVKLLLETKKVDANRWGLALSIADQNGHNAVVKVMKSTTSS
jgi:hypothetical protein